MADDQASRRVGGEDETPTVARGSEAAFGEVAYDWIGPYKLLEIIGEGGFGTVWLAERREPMVQRVALKIIKPGMDSKAVIARFEQERQALAVMDHPNVAKVFDGGVTQTGRPYFVMEHVQGEPITAFCDRHKYPIRARLELFIPVCEAVQHAHHKGIIHRDIKPSNVLVMLKDGHAIPKVIDFGVAKAMSHTLTDKTIFTERGQLIGTPEYMSPEQAEMGRTDIDTRTDVYSLGVVLYELLSGSLPFDSGSLRSAGYAEIQRLIREIDPPRPSARLSTAAGPLAASIARARQSDRERIASELRTDLEWIPLKAMRKDRSERYRGAADISDDISRYLVGLPIEAAPPSVTYVARKLVRRHRKATAVGLLVGLLITGGVIGIAWQAHRAAKARELLWQLLDKQTESAMASADELHRERTKSLLQILRDARDIAARDAELVLILEKAIARLHPDETDAALIALAAQYPDLLEYDNKDDRATLRELDTQVAEGESALRAGVMGRAKVYEHSLLLKTRSELLRRMGDWNGAIKDREEILRLVELLSRS
jgi:non-specific serine/threonine protein kinase/serine/threonine-protein kinase